MGPPPSSPPKAEPSNQVETDGDTTVNGRSSEGGTIKDPMEEIGGFFRGVAAAARAKIPALKAASAKTIRAVGSNRPLAFASEGAVAGNTMMPRWMYYGAWGLSGVAITSDITMRAWDAPDDKKWETAAYYTAFHLPASLIVPAYIIHQVVHHAEHSMKHHSYAKKMPPRARAFFPIGAALLSIIPVVPAVDYAAESIMEPTLGKYLGLKFEHHHHDENQKQDQQEGETKTKQD